jgi:hypothetical protein
MTNEIQIAEDVLLAGDLSKLDPAAKLNYYRKLCDSLGLNPLTKPFEYIRLNGKEVLYAKKDATDQLRKIHGVSITKLEHVTTNGIHIVTAYAQDKTGRIDVATGAASIEGLKGDNLVNATLKAESKAKRRVTLSLVGLGMLDETELDTIPRDVTPRHNVEQVSAPQKDTYALDGFEFSPKVFVETLIKTIDDITDLDSLQHFRGWQNKNMQEIKRFCKDFIEDSNKLRELIKEKESRYMRNAEGVI